MPLQSWTTLSPSTLSSIDLLASDIDGTLTQGGQFTPDLFQGLQQLQRAQIPILLVTGRSAGWVNALVHYLPVQGAIAENGGVYDGGLGAEVLVPIAPITHHRQQLAQMFGVLQGDVPDLQPAGDNPFRWTDWTFGVDGLTWDQIQTLAHRCHDRGWGFTYSTVQCHIMVPQQNKAAALQQVLARHFPHLAPHQVLTLGDSPNDESLFDPEVFPHSVGVANLLHYGDRLRHLPAYVTPQPEVAGFREVVARLIAAKVGATDG